MNRSIQHTKKRTGRPRTGSVKLINGRWKARITLDDGSRRWIALDETIAPEAEDQAREVARALARASHGHISQGTRETFEQYAGRWLAAREGRIVSIRDDRSRLRDHVFPVIGPLPIEDVTAEHIEDVVARLDRRVALPKVHADRLSWKTAINVWAVLRKCLDDAAHAKNRALRVLAGPSPAANVRGPDRSTRKARQFLYPDEFLRFLRSPVVPLQWKRLVTVAVYLYARDGELRVISWEDGTLDLDRGVAHIHMAWDRRSCSVKAPKSGHARELAIEPALVPLLAAMKKEAGGRGRAFARPSDRDLSRGLRRWLKKGGVTRRQLFEATETTAALTFHDLRATGITWLAVRRDPQARIQHWAGHARPETTATYIRRADALPEGFGIPFPELPLEQLGVSADFRLKAEMRNAEDVTSSAFQGVSLRGGRDSKPQIAVQVRDITSPDATEEPGPDRLSTRSHVSAREVDHEVDRRSGEIATRALALAAAIEAMSGGHVRVIAEQLRALLEEAAGPTADVIPIGRDRER